MIPEIEIDGNIVTASIGRCDVPNDNNRIYPREVWLKVIQDFRENNFVPLADRFSSNLSAISLAEIGGFLSDIRIDEQGYVIGTFELKENLPTGRKIKDLLTPKPINFSFSTCGCGTCHSGEIEGQIVVGNDYSLKEVVVTPKPATFKLTPQESTALEVAASDVVTGYIRSLNWGDLTDRETVGLVEANIRGFASWLRENPKEAKILLYPKDQS